MTDIVEKPEPTKFPPLEHHQRERVYDLLCETADMGIALRRLLESEDPERCEAVYPEIIGALDKRLVGAMNILTDGSEEV